MKDLLEISCGLDVHKEKIVACILTGPLGKPTRSEIREFSTLIPDMIALRHWIVSKNCHHVAMESTGIYWMPIYEILEDALRNCLGDCRETQHLSFGMVLENQTEKRSQKSDCRTCPKTSCHHLHNVKTRNSI